MCLGCRRRRRERSFSCAVAGTLIAVAGCGAEPQPAAVRVAPPLVNTAVGPLAGAQQQEPEPANPFAENRVALAEGRRFFLAYNCAGCHGDHGGGGMGPSLRDADWIYGNSHGQIAKSIAEGRALGMPAWRVMLTPAQIWQVTAYLKSLGTDREPQRPR
jgi:cytochrome c oxidase cbb3-type subunit III